MSTTATVGEEMPREAARRLADPFLRRGFKPEAMHEYRDADGRPLFWVLRLRHPETHEKEIRPMHFNGEGYALIRPERPPQGWPLYRLPEVLKTDRGAPTFVVEGESCVDKLIHLGVTATTSGGASSADTADWAPLKGRRVILWPDNDKPGEQYACDVSRILRGLGCRVELVDVEALDLPEHGDVADWLREHPNTTAEDVLALPRKPVEAARAPGSEREPADADHAPAAIVRRIADIEREELAWLWPGRFPLGKLSLLAGDPGLGKSLIAVALAAAVSRGARWPIEAEGTAPLGDAVLISAEDEAADTIRPRLEAAGADLGRVHVLDGIRDVDPQGRPYERPWTLFDLPALDDALAGLPECKLLVIDPVSAFLAGTDSHKNSDVRAVLAPLAELVSRRRVAVVAVSHLNKSAGPAAYRTSGSIAFTAASRAVYAVGKDKADPSRRLVVPIKANLAPDASGLAYRVRTQGGAPVVEWEPDPVAVGADELLAPAVRDQAPTETDEAVEFLRDALRDGPRKAKDVTREAREAGIGDKALRRARERMGIKPLKREFQGGYVWEIPAVHGPNDALPRERASLGIIGKEPSHRDPSPEAARYRAAADGDREAWEIPL